MSAVDAEQGLKDSFDAEARSCRFPDEVNGNATIFRGYSRAGCLAECQLTAAADEVKCLPWNIVRPQSKVNKGRELQPTTCQYLLCV